MTELEKLDAGLEYDMWDEEVNARKQHAIVKCAELASLDQRDEDAIEKKLEEMFGGHGHGLWAAPGFQCDWGKNIFVGDHFLANYNVSILDIMPVHIGDYCMIGPGTVISTVNHPMTAAGRRKHLGVGKPVTIGNDVWIGGNCTILPGVTIGNNVVVAAGAVVTKDVPDNSLVGGVPAKVIRTLETGFEKEGEA